MVMELFVNELSFQGLADNLWIARSRMQQLIEVTVDSYSVSDGIEIRVDGEHFAVELAEGYFLSTWIDDQDVDFEQRRFWSSQISKHPPVDYLTDIDCYYEEKRAIGLANAYVCESIVLSLASEKRWLEDTLEIELLQISDGNCELDPIPAFVSNVVTKQSIESHKEWIQKRTQTQVPNSGRELWEAREQYFPSLAFCESTENALISLRSGDSRIGRVFATLSRLNRQAIDWTPGSGISPAMISPESPETMEQFGVKRQFQCPDGQFRIFHLHSRVAEFSWRVHVVPPSQWDGKRILVGYIGPHLPTKKFH